MINTRDINELHPALTRAAQELKLRMKQRGYDMLVTCTYRDDEAQNALYEQGRSKPGNIVTNARAGHSMHNFRLAFDICKNQKGHEYDDDKFFQTAGMIGEKMGLVWGGKFKGIVDKPHFEYTRGLNLSELRTGNRLPHDSILPWEKEIADSISVGAILSGKTTMLFNGNKIVLERILYNGFNYIKLRDLPKLGFDISYDANNNVTIIAKV